MAYMFNTVAILISSVIIENVAQMLSWRALDLDQAVTDRPRMTVWSRCTEGWPVYMDPSDSQCTGICPTGWPRPPGTPWPPPPSKSAGPHAAGEQV